MYLCLYHCFARDSDPFPFRRPSREILRKDSPLTRVQKGAGPSCFVFTVKQRRIEELAPTNDLVGSLYNPDTPDVQ